jgi:cobyrinic acid a,c-diamide synthase
MAQSIAPLVAGFAGHDSRVHVAGVILNKVGSQRHGEMLRRALAPLGLPVLGTVPRSAELTHPDRHLGLVQAREHSDLDAFLNAAADCVEAHVDMDAILALASLVKAMENAPRIAPPAQVIAVAQDDAFAFSYPHILTDWRKQGSEIKYFSPLNDDAPPHADFIYLPGGYPELHAGRLASNFRFMQGLRTAAAQSTLYGECGGYMTLGEGLIDAQGQHHKMAGLLGVETSFQTRKLHLGYRTLNADQGVFKGHWKAHEFHYATTVKTQGTPLFGAKDSMGTDLAPAGLINGSVYGSFMHLIDRA